MPGRRVVRVYVETTRPVHGIWCRDCALPSAVAVVVLLDGVPHLFQRCLDCRASR